jgi:lactoylglutathione lyase
MPPSLPLLNLLVLRSPDIERAISFYQLLGLTFTRHAHGAGPEHYTAEMGELMFEVYPLTAKSSPTTSVRIGFRVEELDALLAKLTQEGISMVAPPADSQWGRRAVVKDWDGHTVELVEPLSEAGAFQS